MGSFPIAAATNDCKLGGLRQHIFKIVRRLDPDWEKVFAKDITDTGLLSKTYNELLKPNNKKTKGFPSGAVVKNPPANAGDARDKASIPGWGRSPRVGNGNLFQ